MAENDTPEPMADRSFTRFLSGLEDGQIEADFKAVKDTGLPLFVGQPEG